MCVQTKCQTDGRRHSNSFVKAAPPSSWAKDASIGARMINVRAETVAETPAFHTTLRRRRCLVLVDGFYEWQRVAGSKVKRPMRITLRTGEPFAFAGLWEEWRNPEGIPIQSCTIITTAPNELLAPVHNRMPVILPRDAESLWLDAFVGDPALLANVLRPYAAAMDAYEVSPLVNSAANDTPEVLARVGVANSWVRYPHLRVSACAEARPHGAVANSGGL